MPGIFDDESPQRWANSDKSRRDAAHFARGRRFEWLEGNHPTAPLKANHSQNGPRQHRILIPNRP